MINQKRYIRVQNDEMSLEIEKKGKK